MRLVMLTCDHPWQRTLASRLARRHELALVVVDQHFSGSSRAQRIANLRRDPRALFRKVIEKVATRPLARNEASYAAHFEHVGAPPFESTARVVARVPEVNTPDVAKRIEATRPEAIILSGGRLIRAPVLQCSSRYGMINMHPGLSPYYRGVGCTFWALYNEEPEYIGVTIHYVTEGIDSGEIILSARPELHASDGVASLECKVTDLGHELVLRALQLLKEGRAPRLHQWEKGKLFLHQQLTTQARLELERRLRGGLMERCLRRLQEESPSIRTVSAA